MRMNPLKARQQLLSHLCSAGPSAKDAIPLGRRIYSSGRKEGGPSRSTHILREQPRLFFMHFWANDDASSWQKACARHWTKRTSKKSSQRIAGLSLMDHLLGGVAHGNLRVHGNAFLFCDVCDPPEAFFIMLFGIVQHCMHFYRSSRFRWTRYREKQHVAIHGPGDGERQFSSLL